MGSWDNKIFTLPAALHGIYSTGFFTSITTLMSELILSFLLLWLICFCAILCITPLISDDIFFNNFVSSNLRRLSLPLVLSNPSSPLLFMDFPLHKFLFRSFNSFLAHLGIRSRVREQSVQKLLQQKFFPLKKHS